MIVAFWRDFKNEMLRKFSIWFRRKRKKEVGTAVTLSELQSEAFFSETLKWGKYVAEEDRAENPANVWVIVDNAHPKLYFQKWRIEKTINGKN